MTGIELIAAERLRQIEEEGWSHEHDDDHTDGSLAMVAVCYASPELLYTKYEEIVNQVVFQDPWPDSWDDVWDKRFQYGDNRVKNGNGLPDPSTYSSEERLDLLVKAGALIAAEIDRLQRIKK